MPLAHGRSAPVTTRRLRLAIAATLALAIAGCGGVPDNRQLESVHQPVVERSNFTFDLTSGPGGLSPAEQDRLAGWFGAVNLRYGDRIALDDPMASSATRAAVETVAGRFGLLVSAEVPVTPGYVSAGTVRIVLTRTAASVPHCPDWSANSETNLKNATSSNYGCAVNSNMAAMIANPEDLLHGAHNAGDTVGMSAGKAIDAYRAAKPTGAGDLKRTSSQSAGGN